MSDFDEKELQEKLKKIKDEYHDPDFHFGVQVLKYVLWGVGIIALVILGRVAGKFLF